MNTTISFSNGHPSVITELTIKPGVISLLLSVANRSRPSPPSPDAELLFRLMAGQRVKMRLFSAQNIMFYVTTAQLDDAVNRAKATWESCYQGMLSAERLAALYEKFGDERLPMSIQSFYISESMADIQSRLKPLNDAHQKTAPAA